MNSQRCLILLTTTACDIACEYCFYTSGHEQRDSRKLSSSQAHHLGTQLRELGFTTVVITGGDPLGRRSKNETFEIVKILKAASLRVVINTSGAYLTAEDCDRIIEIQPDRIDFSIDSHLENTHNRLRGRFQDVVNAIESLIHRGYKNIVTTTVVNELNIDTLPDTLEFLKNIGVQDRRIQPAYIPENYLKIVPEIAFSLDKKRNSMLSVIAEEGKSPEQQQAYFNLWRKYFNEVPDEVVHQPLRPVCQMGKKFFVADAEGNLSACFHRTDIQLGNILKDTVEALVDSLSHHALIHEELPSCAGAHCISLFESGLCWKREESEYGRVSNG